MKAVRLVASRRPLEMHEIDVPTLGPRDALVRVKAAGICHSDAHYRAGTAPVSCYPITPGHEIAGVVEKFGDEVGDLAVGDRVCVHYMATCGECEPCRSGNEQFCRSGEMFGKARDGGYAELVRVPVRSLFPVPDEVPLEWGAVLMCSSSTSLHALRKARFEPGESVAVFGVGGLGMSAVQLASALGAVEIYAVDIHADRLALAERFGAVAVNGALEDPVEEIMRHTEGRGVDVALELIGLPLTMGQAVRSLGVMGRAALAGITDKPFELASYGELIAKEAEVIGVSDHLATEIPELTELARTRRLDLTEVITRTVPLDADAINETLDCLDDFGDGVRTVILPE